jgi:hypothetical protein
MTRKRLRTAALIAASLLCLALAAGLAAVAVDVDRWRDALPAGDVRYRVSPEKPDTWTPSTLVPVGLSRSLLGVRDDVDFRRALRAFRIARLDQATVSDPNLALLRNQAQARLDAVVSGRDVRSRRSRAAGLVGVLGLARLATETQDRAEAVEAAVLNLRLALTLDPGNDEAKFNLELALQRARGVQITEAGGGADPTPGGSGAEGAGAGDPGTGY